jgi:hypothetical protein
MELHVGFTSAYGITLGFMLLAGLMVVLGKQHYGKALKICLLIWVVNYSQ